METKKTPKADLQKKRLLFLEVGFAVALALAVGVFLLGSPRKTVEPIIEPKPPIPPELIGVTRQPEKQPEMKPAAPRFFTNIINVLKGDVKIDTSGYVWDEPEENMPTYSVEEKAEPIPTLMIAEQMPSFRGGDIDTFREWVYNQIVYPSLARDNDVQGKVVMQFVIDTDGKLIDITALTSPDPSLTDEVVRVLRKSPRWTSGKQRNKAVRVSFVLPIDFVLQTVG